MIKHIKYAFYLLAVLMISAGCGGTSTPASRPSSNAVLSEGVMTASVDDNSKPTGGVKTTFASDVPAVYCSFKVAGVVPEDMIKASLVYVKGEAAGMDNSPISETYMIVESADSGYYLAFFFDKPTSGWMKGEYKVVLSVNSQEKLSIPFSIK